MSFAYSTFKNKSQAIINDDKDTHLYGAPHYAPLLDANPYAYSLQRLFMFRTTVTGHGDPIHNRELGGLAFYTVSVGKSLSKLCFFDFLSLRFNCLNYLRSFVRYPDS